MYCELNMMLITEAHRRVCGLLEEMKLQQVPTEAFKKYCMWREWHV